MFGAYFVLFGLPLILIACSIFIFFRSRHLSKGE